VKIAVGERGFIEFRAETLPVTGRLERLVSVTPIAARTTPITPSTTSTRTPNDARTRGREDARTRGREDAIFTTTLSAPAEVEGIELRRTV
jgi:hypothetical protein